MGKGKSKKPVAKKRQWDWLFWLITIAIIAIVVIAIRDGNIASTNQAQNPTTVQQPVSPNQAPSN